MRTGTGGFGVCDAPRCGGDRLCVGRGDGGGADRRSCQRDLVDLLQPAAAKRVPSRWLAARSAADVWAVGLRPGGRCQYQTLTQHWDGSAWTVIPSPGKYDG